MTGAAPNIPAIRFRGFTEPWEKDLFGKRLKAMPYKQFIKTPEPLGKYPIIQQGEEPLLGKANGLPIEDYANKVVFGDHTVSLYMPTSPFFVATDGVRIFSIDNMSQQLLYVILEKYKPISHGYTRHTSYLYENHYYYPSSTIEQQKICDFFRSQDDAISNSQEQIIKLKYIKQACMQQMFA